jgi:pyruvate/2-oxoglutarate dehydrogenase complex dihydrolipoamide dehydrogenase (E3) component
VIINSARTWILSSVDVDDIQMVTYIEASLQETLPKSALIIGAGVIGKIFEMVSAGDLRLENRGAYARLIVYNHIIGVRQTSGR